MQNKHMNNNQSRGFEKNPYINQGQNMQTQGINTMNTTMQSNPTNNTTKPVL